MLGSQYSHASMMNPMAMGMGGVGMVRVPPTYSSGDVKRRRPYTHLACTQCKEKHQKCDGQKPVCSTCSVKQIECTYRPERNKKREGQDSSQEEAAYLRAEIMMWKDKYDQLKKFVDENLFPICATGIVPGLAGYDNPALDKQLYQMQLQQQWNFQEGLRDQLSTDAHQNQDHLIQDQLLSGVPHSLLGNIGLTGDNQGISQNLLMPNSLFAPQFAQYPFHGLGGFPLMQTPMTTAPPVPLMQNTGELKRKLEDTVPKPTEEVTTNNTYSYMSTNPYLFDPNLDTKHMQPDQRSDESQPPLLAVVLPKPQNPDYQ
eukprot:TRINITY_DN4112_c0_g1_i1.p1 TRINITY_DN4112_c0_g1~~TRINITY_DN4112_c0_g1_i1.p1  ORF type:complete len:315 (+),score=27.00 TRINITY_DN4112_c0_g1_i1:77-1021(+)